MTITARRHALRNRARPSTRNHLGLVTMETLLTLSWTLLLSAVTRLLTGFHLYLMPAGYVLASAMTAWLECPVSAHRTNPLSAFGLLEASVGGKNASQWQTLARVLVTPLFFLSAMSGFIPLLYGRRSIPEIVSGTRIVPLDPALDPRSASAIRRAQNRIKTVVRSYTVFSLAIAVLILLVPVRHRIVQIRRDTGSAESVLSEEDEELLAIYLDLTARNPDRIEFHVRLASLYYRNGMTGDLALELAEVRRLDPHHAILMLELELGRDPSDSLLVTDSLLVIPEIPDSLPWIMSAPVEPDTGAADSTGAVTDSLPTADSLSVETQVPGEVVSEDTSAAGDEPGPLVLPVIQPPPAEIVPGGLTVQDGEAGQGIQAGESGDEQVYQSAEPETLPPPPADDAEEPE